MEPLRPAGKKDTFSSLNKFQSRQRQILSNFLLWGSVELENARFFPAGRTGSIYMVLTDVKRIWPFFYIPESKRKSCDITHKNW